VVVADGEVGNDLHLVRKALHDVGREVLGVAGKDGLAPRARSTISSRE